MNIKGIQVSDSSFKGIGVACYRMETGKVRFIAQKRRVSRFSLAKHSAERRGTSCSLFYLAPGK